MKDHSQPEPRTRVSIYSDIDDFGGHEIQTLELARTLAESGLYSVDFYYFRGNARLASALAKLASPAQGVTGIPHPVRTRRPAALTGLLDVVSTGRISMLLARRRPDVLIAAQGRIEVCLHGLLAARLLGIPAISYIPMSHPLRDIGVARMTGPREKLSDWLYTLPDLVLTISGAAIDSLKARCPRARTALLENLVELPPQPPGTGRTGASKTIGIFGRIEFSQKGQDLLVDRAELLAEALPETGIRIVGDGPDRAALQSSLAQTMLGDRVRFVPWTKDMDEQYRQIDVLLIASRYEGTPLVMIEALSRGIPVVGIDADGMRDWLPPQYRFRRGDAQGMIAALKQALHERFDPAPYRDKLRSAADRTRFLEQAASAIGLATGAGK